jgi:hypothetical protein
VKSSSSPYLCAPARKQGIWASNSGIFMQLEGKHFSAFIGFAGTLVGAITGYYFGGTKPK